MDKVFFIFKNSFFVSVILRFLFFRALLIDAQAARESFPGDSEVELICDVLQLVQGALSYEASTLAGQLVGLLSSLVSRRRHFGIMFANVTNAFHFVISLCYLTGFRREMLRFNSYQKLCIL